MHILPSRGEESLEGASEEGPGERCVSLSYMKALREKQTRSYGTGVKTKLMQILRRHGDKVK